MTEITFWQSKFKSQKNYLEVVVSYSICHSDCVSYVFLNQLWGFLIFVFNVHEEMNWIWVGWIKLINSGFKRLMVKTKIIRMRKQKILWAVAKQVPIALRKHTSEKSFTLSMEVSNVSIFPVFQRILDNLLDIIVGK